MEAPFRRAFENLFNVCKISDVLSRFLSRVEIIDVVVPSSLPSLYLTLHAGTWLKCSEYVDINERIARGKPPYISEGERRLDGIGFKEVKHALCATAQMR